MIGRAAGLADRGVDGRDVRSQCWVPEAANWTFCEISRVAAPCCSTALAIAVVTSSIWRIATPTSLTEATAVPVEVWMPWTCWAISWVAFAVCSASDLTSCATTANPRPASPARAASMVALSASKLVCAAMAWIRSTTEEMLCAACARPSISVSERAVTAPAVRTVEFDSSIWRPISRSNWLIPRRRRPRSGRCSRSAPKPRRPRPPAWSLRRRSRSAPWRSAS